jgi:hypothetical protein
MEDKGPGEVKDVNCSQPSVQQSQYEDYLNAEYEGFNINKDYDLQKEFKDRISVLCVAYHNCAVE